MGSIFFWGGEVLIEGAEWGIWGVDSKANKIDETDVLSGTS